MAVHLAETTPRAARVFLSYKRNVESDSALADEVVAALSSAGHAIFVDKQLRVGQDWAAEIDRRVRQSHYLIVLLTAESILSEMVRAEIEIARDQAAKTSAPRILPVRLRFEGPLPYPINAYLDPVQYTLWAGPADTPRLLRELLDAVGGGAPLETGSTGAPVAPAVNLPPLYAAPLPPGPLPEPGGTLDVDDPWYVPRKTDALALDHVRQPGQTLTIKGPRQMGKSSLLMRTVKAGMEAGKKVALLDFQLVGEDSKADADLFFRRFSSWVAEQLNLPDTVEKFWNSAYASPQNCTRYMEQHVLEPLGGPCIFAIDETDAIFQTSFSQDFFSMLRSWHNSRATSPIWKQLDHSRGFWVIVNATTGYTWRAHVTLDRPYYFTMGQLFFTDEVSMPDIADLGVSGGYNKNGLKAEGMVLVQRTKGGGDIRRQDMPFVSNRMNAFRAGGMVMYPIPKLESLAVNFAGSISSSRRSFGVGKSTSKRSISASHPHSLNFASIHSALSLPYADPT